jgi:seryl-tRNA synthetase
MNGIFHLLTEKLLSEGFILMYVPTLVKERLLYGTSHFPADADQVYKVDSSNVENKRALYLLGSAESSLIGYWMDKVIKKENLPIKATAITTCFRSEAGSWGKDVRGIKRVHQFDKQEMIMIVENSVDQARKAHEYLLSINEWLLQKLELPYRVINMCYGELGYAAAAKKYDYELWLPSQQSFMEVGSNSITTDYQARRLNIRYQDDDKKIKYVYTLNDTGATHRLLIGIIDHYQQSDGSLLVPKVLRKYVGKDKIK